MQITKCQDGATFMQLGQKSGPKVCETAQGLELHFADQKVQEKLARMMTPAARKAIHELLGRVQAKQAKVAADLLQERAKAKPGSSAAQDLDDDDDDDTDNANAAGAAVTHAVSALGLGAKQEPDFSELQPPAQTEKVVKYVDAKVAWKKCTQGPPDCGLLHDNMSLMWGKFKDLVDELQQEMDKNEFEYESLMANYNEQLEVLRNSKARFVAELNEATANLNAAREEVSEKEQERIELEHAFEIKMKENWMASELH